MLEVVGAGRPPCPRAQLHCRTARMAGCRRRLRRLLRRCSGRWAPTRGTWRCGCWKLFSVSPCQPGGVWAAATARVLHRQAAGLRHEQPGGGPASGHPNTSGARYQAPQLSSIPFPSPAPPPAPTPTRTTHPLASLGGFTAPSPSPPLCCTVLCCAVQVCTERLREWFAARLLKPLVAAVDGAHQRVVDAAARLGWAGLQLSPLHEAVTGSSAAVQHRAGM